MPDQGPGRRPDFPFDQWPFRGPAHHPHLRHEDRVSHGFKQLGDRLVPTPITVRFQRADRPDVLLTFDVAESELVCTSVQVDGADSGRISGDDLVGIPIDEITTVVLEHWSVPTEVPAGDGVVTWAPPAPTGPMGWPNHLDLRSMRRPFDTSRLHDIAEVYLKNPDAPTKAVADAFGVAHRTASLYAKRAREAHPELFTDGNERHHDEQ